MRRIVYSGNMATKFGEATAVAGADQTVESVGAITNLDGTGSSTTGGSITGYLWEIISGYGLVLDTPTASTTSVSGSGIIGDHVIQLTVTDTNGNTDTDTLTITIEVGAIITISNDGQDGAGQGTLTIANGQAGETIGLSYALFGGDYPDAMTITGGALDGTLNYVTTSQTGSIVLDGSGEASEVYTGSGYFFQVSITIVSRSSGATIPKERATFVDFSALGPE